ncbi:hypothetical protein ABT160_42865 [Streptomyces sp. NPDC001941]|uniref:hypothetical protein n=1 Tax=Streptomyces sp. NPDC001941 TaxID=3154659 RepID=UPI0033326F5D
MIEQNTLLTYDITTTPNPLQASPPVAANDADGQSERQVLADIDIIVSNTGSNPVKCRKIMLLVPLGDLAQDLGTAGQSLAASVSPSETWTIGAVQDDVLLALPHTEEAVFEAASSTCRQLQVSPAQGEAVVDQEGLHIHIAGVKINSKVGTSHITVNEEASDTANPEFATRSLSLSITKFAYRGSGDPLHAHPGINRGLAAFDAKTDVPAGRVAAGTELKLTWNHRRDDLHELYINGSRVPDNNDQIKLGSSYTVPKDTVKMDTIFTLKTTIPDVSNQPQPPRWDHVTVTVNNPTLEALTTMGLVTSKGGVTVADGKELKATGEVNATGLVTANSGLTVTGDTALQKLTSGAAFVTSLDAKGGVIQTTGALMAGGTSVDSLDAREGAITTDGTLRVGSANVTSLNAGDGEIKTNGTVTANAMRSGNRVVLRHGDCVTMYAKKQNPSGSGYLSADMNTSNNVRTIRESDVDQSKWMILQENTKALSSDED